MIKRVFSVLIAITVCFCALSLSAFADEVLINLPDVTLYALRGQAVKNGVTIPDDYLQSHQIEVECPYTVYYAVSLGNSAAVSKDGLVTPKCTNMYWHDGISTEKPTGTEGEYSEIVPIIGKTNIIIKAGPDNYSIDINVCNYAEIYADGKISEYADKNITDEMSAKDKLSAIADFAESFDYCSGITTAADMIATGSGNTAAHTEAIIMLCKQTGIDAWERSTAKDKDKTANTNIVAQIGDKLYTFTSTVDNNTVDYTVDEKGSLYSYTSVETAAEIYQYDGNPDSFDGVLNIPSEIDGKTVTGIATNTFYKCSGVTKAILPDTVEYIGDGAFSGLTDLQSVKIPASLKSIGKYVFNGCTSLTDITCPDECESFSAENGVIYDKNKTVLIYAPAAASVVIPDSVKEIAGYSCRMNSNITEITIPSGVATIGEGAFGDCTALTFANIEFGVQSMENFAFYRCKNLAQITIPDTVTSIGSKALVTNSNLNVCCLVGSYAQEYCAHNDIATLLTARKPEAPTVDQILRNCIILTAVDGCEYSMDGENWQQSNVFENLETASDYTFYQRVAKSNDVLESEKSDGVTVKTLDDGNLIYGDSNMDGRVDMLDVLLIRKYIAKQPVMPDLTVTDVNDDGSIDMLDVLLIRKYIAKQPVILGPQPKPPMTETPDVIETPDIVETPDIM